MKPSRRFLVVALAGLALGACGSSSHSSGAGSNAGVPSSDSSTIATPAPAVHSVGTSSTTASPATTADLAAAQRELAGIAASLSGASDAITAADPAQAQAQENSAAFGTQAAAVTASPCRAFTDMRATAQREADRRAVTLTNLVALLRARQDPFALNGSQIGALQSANAGIAALEKVLQSTCYATRAEFATAARPVFTQYRVYWLRVPQTRVIQAADLLAEARARLGDVAAKLTAHVTGNAKATADVSAMNAALASADAKLGKAPTPGSSIAVVSGLQPAVDMHDDTAAIDTARGDLASVRQSLQQARADALQALTDLK